MPKTTIVWFRHDLRLADHPALYEAAERGPVLPLFIWTPEEEAPWAPGGAHRWWLHHSLRSLDKALHKRGLQFIRRIGSSEDVLRELIDGAKAGAVYWNRRYEPRLLQRDEQLLHTLRADGIEARAYESQILHHPDAIKTTSGGPYHVYTPFWEKLKSELDPGDPLPVPSLNAPATWPDSVELDAFGLLPEARDGTDWAGGLCDAWMPGEDAAHRRLDYFLMHTLSDYGELRDRPDRDGTSRLSPYLHHGELSIRQVWTAVTDWTRPNGPSKVAEPFLQELGWREFSYHMLYHYPDTPSETYRDKFKIFGWRDQEEVLRRWQRGQTGYPIVDAGMRQLWKTGWMHNRVRMIAASFLTKDLLIPWQRGARWFWDTLVDGNLANNTMGWQWSAGSGADAQPFFRIFNPVVQGERHDPNGDYVRRWVPELAALPIDHLHQPWNAPAPVLDEAGIKLGTDYPKPVVDHAEARDRAMTEYEKIR